MRRLDDLERRLERLEAKAGTRRVEYAFAATPQQAEEIKAKSANPNLVVIHWMSSTEDYVDSIHARHKGVRTW